MIILIVYKTQTRDDWECSALFKAYLGEPPQRLVVAVFPLVVEFTYGKRVNKVFKGTEKAGDLLQFPSRKSRCLEQLPVGRALCPYPDPKQKRTSTAKRPMRKATGSLGSMITHYDY